MNPSAQPEPSFATEPVSERNYDGVGYKINFQYGPVKVVGKTGCQIEDLVNVCISRIKFLNDVHEGGKFRCRENSLAITKLEEAVMWLNRRTSNRISQGVEGQEETHKS